MFFERPEIAIPLIPVLLFSLTVHEFSHAWSALKLGDPTAAALGRLTLNPMRHLDPFGTLILLATFRFGWAKPVPVNVYNFRDPKFGMFLTSAAGPASNILLAICSGLLLRGYYVFGGGAAGGFMESLGQILWYSLSVNVSLAVFNLIPIPPLDGSNIILGLAPASWEEPLLRFQRIGPIFLFAIIGIGFITGYSPLWIFISPVVHLFAWVFAGIPL